MMARDRVVSRLVQSFGGISAMARALGHMHSSTVQGWKEQRAIPRWGYYEIRHSERARRDPTIRDLIDSLDEMDASPPVAPSCEPEGCRYIHGYPKGAWSYCNRPQRPGSPYCAEHHALYRLPADHAATLADIEVAAEEVAAVRDPVAILLGEEEP